MDEQPDALVEQLNQLTRDLADAWTLIGRLDYFLETYESQPIVARRRLAKQLRGEIKKALDARGATKGARDAL